MIKKMDDLAEYLATGQLSIEVFLGRLLVIKS